MTRRIERAMALLRHGDLSVTEDAVVRGETGDQTDQESRSAGHRAAPIMTAMDITIHASRTGFATARSAIPRAT